MPPRVVVVGAGYAGLSTAIGTALLVSQRATVELVDSRSEHELITRLYLVAADRIAPAGAAVPVAELLAGSGVVLRRARVHGIDVRRGRLETTAGPMSYDHLVLALGSESDDRGIPGVPERALPIRTLQDATRLRNTLQARIHRAVHAPTKDRRRLLTFVVVGGGYTGIEVAAELAAWLPRLAAACSLPPSDVRIGLLETGPRLLPGYDPWLAEQARAALEALQVQTFLRTPVAAVGEDGVCLRNGGLIRAGTVVWAAGLRAPRLLAEAGLPVGQSGRARVDSELKAVGHPQVMILGDSALALDPATGAPLPPSAQVAVQQARVAAESLAGVLSASRRPRFVPHILGEALALGPGRGAATVGEAKLRGPSAIAVKWLAHARYLASLGGPRLVAQQLSREALARHAFLACRVWRQFMPGGAW
jgi:NADH dehydrogenase